MVWPHRLGRYARAALRPGPELRNLLTGRFCRRELSLVVRGFLADHPAFDVAVFQDVAQEANLEGAARTLSLPDPSQGGQVTDFRIGDMLGAGSTGRAIAIYAPTGILASWERMEEDVEALLSRRPLVVLALVQRWFRTIPVEGHTYLLSTILNALPLHKFEVHLQCYRAPDLPLASLAGNLLWPPSRPIGLWKDGDAPTTFSALVLSIRRNLAARH